MVIFNVAKTAVFNQAGHVLLIRRSKTDTRRPGEWDFPGGQIENGEDVAAAAARELQEEAGLVVKPSELVVIYAETKPFAEDDRSITRFLLTLKLSEDQPVKLSFEHDDYKWVDVDTAIVEFPHFFYTVGLAYARDHGLL